MEDHNYVCYIRTNPLDRHQKSIVFVQLCSSFLGNSGMCIIHSGVININDNLKYILFILFNSFLKHIKQLTDTLKESTSITLGLKTIPK